MLYGRLFDVIREDANAALVQVVSGGSEPVVSAGCTVYDYAVSNHPTEAEIDAVVETLFPIQVVITHQSQWASRPYKDKYNSFVWTTDGNRDERDLYGDGRWVHPPWLKEWTVRDIRGKHRTAERPTSTDSFPALDRADKPALAAEGLDVDGVRARLHLPTDTAVTDGTTTTSEPNANTGKSRTIEATTPEVATTESPVTADDSKTGPSTKATLSAVLSRLDTIEAAVSRPSVRARVVDAGDGVVLLRPLEDLDLDGGSEVEITIVSNERTDDLD